MSQTSAHMASGSYAREFLLVAAAWALAAALSFAMTAMFAPGNLLFLLPAGLAAFAMFRGAYLSAQASQAFVFRAVRQSTVAFVAWIVVFALVLAVGAFAGLSLPGAGQAMGEMLAIGG